MLSYVAMIFNAEDYRICGFYKSEFFNCLENILKGYFGGHCVAVIDLGNAFGTIPAVKFDAAAALLETAGVGVGGGFGFELVTG